MASKIIKTTAAISLALSSCSVLASNFEFQKGFYIGANTGASFVTAQTQNVSSIDNVQGLTRTIARHEDSARGYNGGVLLGWDFYADKEYIVGVVASGNAYTNRGFQTYSNPGAVVPQHFQESWKMNYSADLNFKPGWFISESTELYALLGASVARIDTEYKNFVFYGYDNKPLEQKKTLYGAVLGAGVQKQLCNRFSVFASYQYTYYGKTRLNDVVINTEGGLISTDHRKMRIDTNVAKIGLIYTF